MVQLLTNLAHLVWGGHQCMWRTRHWCAKSKRAPYRDPTGWNQHPSVFTKKIPPPLLGIRETVVYLPFIYLLYPGNTQAPEFNFPLHLSTWLFEKKRTNIYQGRTLNMPSSSLAEISHPKWYIPSQVQQWWVHMGVGTLNMKGYVQISPGCQVYVWISCIHGFVLSAYPDSRFKLWFLHRKIKKVPTCIIQGTSLYIYITPHYIYIDIFVRFHRIFTWTNVLWLQQLGTNMIWPTASACDFAFLLSTK